MTESTKNKLELDAQALRLAGQLSRNGFEVKSGSRWSVDFSEEAKAKVKAGEPLNPEEIPKTITFPKEEVGDETSIRDKVEGLQNQIKSGEFAELINAMERNEATRIKDRNDDILQKISKVIRRLFPKKTKKKVKDVLEKPSPPPTPPTPPTPPETPPEVPPTPEPEDPKEEIEEPKPEPEPEEVEEAEEEPTPSEVNEEIATAPEDQEDYTPPPMGSEEGKEGEPGVTILYEIEPIGNAKAPTGKFIKKRFSNFDRNSKKWKSSSTPKPYSNNVDGNPRFQLSAKIHPGKRHPLPIPLGCTVDASSLKADGNAQIFRDEKGCFYVSASAGGDFSVEFVKTGESPNDSPVSDDKRPLYKGKYSPEAESLLSSVEKLSSDSEKAKALVSYIHKTYKYPGDGQDLSDAGKVQAQLFGTSTAETYLPNIEKAEAIECHSANTLFIDWCRRLGIPARRVGGYAVSRTKNGKSQITGNDGHAWSEIWDGSQWLTIDATPSQTEETPDDNASEDDTPTEDMSDEITPSPEMDEITEQEEGEQESDEAANEATEKAQKYAEQIRQSESAKDLLGIKGKYRKDKQIEPYYESLDKLCEMQLDRLKQRFSQNLDQMQNDGFLGHDEKQQWLSKAKEIKDIKGLSNLEDQLGGSNPEFEIYKGLKAEVQPLVDRWFGEFKRVLPKEEEFYIDESFHTDSGDELDIDAVVDPSMSKFGKVFHPRDVYEEQPQPKFMASIGIDASGSYHGQMEESKRLLVFLCELFDKLEKELGYLRFSAFLFSNRIVQIKDFDEGYNDGPAAGNGRTVKKRIVRPDDAGGGDYNETWRGLQHGGAALNMEKKGFPDYQSRLFMIGDFRDSNTRAMQNFIADSSDEGFGEHGITAIAIGDEGERKHLARVVGDENAHAAPLMSVALDQTMNQVLGDMKQYTDKLRR